MVSARCSETLAALAAALTARHWTLATAESCTGGLIGAAITDLPGASAYFLGGIIAYDNRIKNQLLGVPETILAAHGAVSAQTVEAMAAGARRQLSADCAIAVSGVAGPDGGTPEKPVGLVYIGWALPASFSPATAPPSARPPSKLPSGSFCRRSPPGSSSLNAASRMTTAGRPRDTLQRLFCGKSSF
jgi:PncC family amidohydrolase